MSKVAKLLTLIHFIPSEFTSARRVLAAHFFNKRHFIIRPLLPLCVILQPLPKFGIKRGTFHSGVFVRRFKQVLIGAQLMFFMLFSPGFTLKKDF